MKIAKNGFRARQAKLRNRIKELKLPAFMTTNLVNIRYLTGFDCSSGILMAFADRTVFITDTRYETDAKRRAVYDEVAIAAGSAATALIGTMLADAKIKKLAFEAEDMTVARLEAFRSGLPGVSLEPTNGVVEELRLIKEPREVKLIRKASHAADVAFAKILPMIKPGVTERQVARALEAMLWDQGIETLAFDTIVASGGRSAFPHARPSNKKIRKGDFVMMDFGVCFEGYRCDMTRTVLVGEPTPEQRRIYQALRRSQVAAREAIKPGVALEKPDVVAREVLESEGLEKNFTHGLGHGVGMEAHEAPAITRGREGVFRKGMIFTVEPGVYIGRWGGIRIEDTCVLTAKGATPLTKSPRRLVIVGTSKKETKK